MQQREKILLIALSSAAAIWFVLPRLESILLGPLAGLRNQKTNLAAEIDRLEDRKLQVLTATRELGELTNSSLPPEPALAQTVYQNWLVKLAELAGCTSPEVTLESRVRHGDVFTVVPVKLTMQGTLEQLTRFVALFESTHVAHSIAYLNMESTGSDGDPRFELIVRCEGISVQKAAERTRLFPQAVLADELTEGSKSISVRSDVEFADLDSLEGQRIRIGTELLTITKAEGTTWTVERGVDGTLVTTADANEVVELMPRREGFMEDPLADWESLLAANPFTKPDPPFIYNPQIATVPDQMVIQGIPWDYTLEPTGWDPDNGSPLFAFDSEVPEGLSLDRSSGELTWETDEATPIGDWDVTIRAVASRDPSIAVSTDFVVSVRMVNLPPIVTVPSQVLAYSGQPVEIPISAEDPDGDSEKITFTAAGETTEGIETDAEAGLVTWTPSIELDLGEYTLEIDVEDGGDPPEVVTAKIRVDVVEDDAFFTHYVGVMTLDGKPEAWFYNRMAQTEGYFEVGDQVQIGNVDGEVVSISAERVVLRNDAELFAVTNGGSLRDREILETYPTSGEEEPSTDDSAPAPSEDESDENVEADASDEATIEENSEADQAPSGDASADAESSATESTESTEVEATTEAPPSESDE